MGSPESRLEKAEREARADVGRLEVSYLLDPRAVVAGRKKCRAFNAKPLGPPEQVSVLVVCAASRAIKRGETGRGAYEVERAVSNIDENRQVAPGIEVLSFPDAHRSDRWNLGDRFPRIVQGFRRVGLASFEIDERAHDRLIERVRS